MISLKMDIATRMDKHILGINVQYIKDYKICVNTLGMIQIRKRHTGEFLRQEILNCLQQYDVDISQVYSSTTDNGANVVKASKLLQELQDEMQVLTENNNEELISIESDDEFEEIHSRLTSILAVVKCAAHTIQLAANDVIKKIEKDLEESRKVVKLLRTVIRGNELTQNIKMPTLDNATRWNSSYDMINSLLIVKNFAEENERIPEINWYFVENFVKAFKPLSDCTKKFQNEQYVMGDFYRDWLCCELKLEEISSEENLYAGQLLTSLKCRKENLLTNEAFITAIYVDPRFNFVNAPFLNEEQKNIAVRHLLGTNEAIKKLAGRVLIEEVTGSQQPSSSSSLLDGEFSILENNMYSLIGATPTTPMTGRNLKQKLENLCYKERVPFDANILEYWKNQHHKDPEIGKLIQIVLAVPSTQVSVERAFSALSTILTKLRSRLSKETINNILLVKLNSNLLQQIAID